MLPKGAIHAAHVWKRFRADRGRPLLRDEVARLAARLRGDGHRGWRWALRDTDVLASPGDSIGLVGANGSGKTTLLRILTGVMAPYAGEVEVSGRIGALLEVSAGIHPELSGQENIHLYGSLLGFRRREIAARFDEIVSFAEIEHAIDRQVKFYSSGMKMRLGFAVAAFLEPDVLLVDEVLAVGDQGFQQKCLDRMRAVLGQGTTLVFVSHDLYSVEAMCSRGIWLHNGVIEAEGPVRDVLSAYRGAIEEEAALNARGSGPVRLLKAVAGGPRGGAARSHQRCEVTLVLEAAESMRAHVCIGVSEGTHTPVFLVRRNSRLRAGETEVRCTIRNLPLPRGRFYLWASVLDADGKELLPWHPAARFDVAGPDLDPAPRAVKRLAPVQVQADWEID